MLVAIGTQNDGKILGVKKAFSHYFDLVEVKKIAVDSDVSSQPKTLDEIVRGAQNRAVKAFVSGECDVLEF